MFIWCLLPGLKILSHLGHPGHCSIEGREGMSWLLESRSWSQCWNPFRSLNRLAQVGRSHLGGAIWVTGALG